MAQGVEAGGHLRGTVGLLPLLAGVLDAVSVPVRAAGGIASAARWRPPWPPTVRTVTGLDLGKRGLGAI